MTRNPFTRFLCRLGLHDWDHLDRIRWEQHEGRAGKFPTRCKRCPAQRKEQGNA